MTEKNKWNGHKKRQEEEIWDENITKFVTVLKNWSWKKMYGTLIVRADMLRVFITWQMKISYVSYRAQYWYASKCKHFLYEDKVFVLWKLLIH